MIVRKIKPPNGGTHDRRRINDLIEYITTAETGPKDDKTEKCLFYKAYNTFSQDRDRIKAEFAALQEAGHNARWIQRREFMSHWVISFKGIERPELGDIEKACARFLKETGFSEHQAIMGVHVNTDNIHVHLAISLINPATHTMPKNYSDVVGAHAALSGIEKMLGTEPERNALFSWNAFSGAVPNVRHAYVSRKFAYASPEVVQVVFPEGEEKPVLGSFHERQTDGREDETSMKFPALVEKGDCWFYGKERDACAVWDEERRSIYFMNWNYRDTVRRILRLKQSNPHVMIIAQHELAPYFVAGKRPDRQMREETREMMKFFTASGMHVYTGETEEPLPIDPQVWVRAQPPSFDMTAPRGFRAVNPEKFYLRVKTRYRRKMVPEIRLRSLSALTMAAHGYPRGEIRDCLKRDGMGAVEADSLLRWMYSPAGKTEMYRQRKQGSLLMARPRGAKPAAAKKRISVPRLRFGLSGEIVDASRRRLDLDDNAVLWRLLKLRGGDMMTALRKIRTEAGAPPSRIREGSKDGEKTAQTVRLHIGGKLKSTTPA